MLLESALATTPIRLGYQRGYNNTKGHIISFTSRGTQFGKSHTDKIGGTFIDAKDKFIVICISSLILFVGYNFTLFSCRAKKIINDE